MSANKFNDFSKAKDEVSVTEEVKAPKGIPVAKKERKEPMSIVLPPSKKKKLKEMASSVNMSASELILYWIDNQE